MEKMKFKCTLLSDIILSQSASTEGNQYSLDFIPGNNFLGIVAAYIYNKVSSPLDVFHSGKVRFGDANPSIQNEVRGLKVPSAMYYPKLKKASQECYIHHLIPAPDSDAIKGLQLKQCRQGFYTFAANTGRPIDIEKHFAIKSAYDADKRRSKDGQMFGYQSLPEGLTLYFEVESDLDATTNKQITEALTDGNKHIGRSKTAQYGLVKIEKADYEEVASTAETFILEGLRYATVYADARLVFLDENGEPTFRPKASDLGFGEEAKIVWSKSQVRTFQYSPWNGKRHTYDTDRCGIEKGSVLVVECATSPTESRYVGAYNNEGFGKVIFNPAFLKGNAEGKADYTLQEPESQSTPAEAGQPTDIALIRFLEQQKGKAADAQSLYEDVNDFIAAHAAKFSGEQFASQWGSIRNIAMIVPDEADIRARIIAFLDHGVAKAKWEERGRRSALESFMDNNTNIRERVMNLASEMAKKCRKEEKA